VPALGRMQIRGDGNFAAEFVRRARFAFADAFGFRRCQDTGNLDRRVAAAAICQARPKRVFRAAARTIPPERTAPPSCRPRRGSAAANAPQKFHLPLGSSLLLRVQVNGPSHRRSPRHTHIRLPQAQPCFFPLSAQLLDRRPQQPVASVGAHSPFPAPSDPPPPLRSPAHISAPPRYAAASVSCNNVSSPSSPPACENASSRSLQRKGVLKYSSPQKSACYGSRSHRFAHPLRQHVAPNQRARVEAKRTDGPTNCDRTYFGWFCYSRP